MFSTVVKNHISRISKNSFQQIISVFNVNHLKEEKINELGLELEFIHWKEVGDGGCSVALMLLIVHLAGNMSLYGGRARSIIMWDCSNISNRLFA